VSELASSSPSTLPYPAHTPKPRPQPLVAWFGFFAGAAFVISLLAWPTIRHLAPALSNPEDQWLPTILLALPDTGFRVLMAVVVAAIIAFVLAIVTSSGAPDWLFRRVRWSYTLIAAFPLLAWVYVMLAAPTIEFLKGHEATTAATLAVIFPLTVPFTTTLRSASNHAIVRHARQFGAGRYWRMRLALRVAAPSMLDALRVASLGAWSVVLFAESQVTMRTDQGIGGILLVWSRNGATDFSRVLIACLAVCVAAVLIAETMTAAETIILHNNGPDY
jgi:hypothetical protein